jgi:hypothetical protein
MVAVEASGAELEGRIRQAAGGLEFREAQALWDGLVERLDSEIRCGRVARSDLERIGELVRWVREMALSARAQASDRIG